MGGTADKRSPTRSAIRAFRQRLGEHRELIRVVVATWQNRLRVPKPNRLPAQPWRLAAPWLGTEVARLPARPTQLAVVPTAYDANGPVDFDWPFKKGIPGFDVRVVHSPDAIILPRRVAISPKGGLLPLVISRKNDALAKLPLETGYVARYELSGSVDATIDQPVFVADSCWPAVYGHFLLEILPTLVLRDLLPQDTLVFTSAPLTRTLFRTFETLGVPPDRVRRIEGAMFCSKPYWGEPLSRLGSGLHPAARQAYDKLLALGSASRITCPERIFISRTGIKQRPLAQEAAVEAVFEQRGFAIVHPEVLLIEDQIALFSRARMIAGLGGSAMHSAVFAKPETPILIVQTRDMGVGVDVAISPPSRRLGYVFGRSEQGSSPYSCPWTVDVRDVEAAADAHFA